MRLALRSVVAFVAAIGVVLTLSSCTPATFVWGFVGERADLKLAFCSTSVATMARLVVYERPERELIEVQSAVWSGPRIQIPEGAIVGSDVLPKGWQQTGELELDGSWERIDIALYDGAEYVDFAILNNADVDIDEWSLSPRPSLLAGTARCTSPYEAKFETLPVAIDRTDSAVDEARLIAMPDEEFWAHMSVLDVAASDGSTRKLVDELALLRAEQVDAFHAQLMLQYFTLDTALIWNEGERQRDIDYEYGFSTSDAFLDLRSAIIRGGKDSVESALSGESFPTAARPSTYPSLSDVAVAAHEAAGNDDTTTTISLTIDLGKNAEGW